MEETDIKATNDTKFFWIKDIIRANVISKIKGRQYANIIDLGANSGTLLSQIVNVFPDSRFYAYPLYSNKNPELLTENIRLMNDKNEVKSHRYDLILSVFDIHVFNWLQVNEFIKFIYDTSDKESSIIISDISANTITANLMIKLGSLLNPRLKSVISLEQAEELFKTRGFEVIEKEIYRINNVWSGWIISLKKIEI